LNSLQQLAGLGNRRALIQIGCNPTDTPTHTKKSASLLLLGVRGELPFNRRRTTITFNNRVAVYGPTRMRPC